MHLNLQGAFFFFIQDILNLDFGSKLVIILL